MDNIHVNKSSNEDMEAADKKSRKHGMGTMPMDSIKSEQDMAASDSQESTQDMVTTRSQESETDNMDSTTSYPEDTAAADSKQDIISMRKSQAKMNVSKSYIIISDLAEMESYHDLSASDIQSKHETVEMDNQESMTDSIKSYHELESTDSKSKHDLVAQDNRKSISFGLPSKSKQSTSESEKRVSMPHEYTSASTASRGKLIQEKIASWIWSRTKSGTSLCHLRDSDSASITHSDQPIGESSHQKEVKQLLCKRVIVNDRCTEAIKKWEDATSQQLPPLSKNRSLEEQLEHQKLVKVDSISNISSFDRGFGFFLVQKVENEMKLPILKKYLNVISSVTNYEAKDRLLCFAHDYMNRMETSTTTHTKRTVLLLDILNIIGDCNAGSILETESAFKNISAAIKGMESVYMGTTLGQMNKLLQLRTQMSPFKNFPSMTSLSLTSLAESDINILKAQSIEDIRPTLESCSEEDFANLDTEDLSSCCNLLKDIQENKGDCDQEDMSNIEKKMTMMAKVVTIRERHLSRARLVMIRQTQDLKDMKQQQEEMDDKLKELRNKLKQYLRSPRPSLMEVENKRLSDTGPPKKEKNPPKAQRSESNASNSNNQNDPIESNINNQNDPIESNMNDQNEEINIEKDKQRNAKTEEKNDNSEEEENPSVENENGSSSEEDQRDQSEEPARVSSSKQVLKLKPSAENVSIKSRRGSLKQLSKKTKSKSFEEDDDLKQHMLTYIKQSMDHAGALLENLKNLTKKAREEEMTMLQKRNGFEQIADRMKKLISTTKERRACIPSIDFRKNSCIIGNRIAVEHSCMICMCHQVPETVHINLHHSSFDSLEESYHKYSEWLKEVRSQYFEAHGKLLTMHTTTKQASQTSFQKSDDGTIATKSIDENLQEEVARMADVPEDENKLLQHTTHVKNSVSNITKQLIAVIQELKDNLNNTRSQTIFLDNLTKSLLSVEMAMKTIVLGMAQNRSHGQVLITSKILRAFLCSDCYCHCVPEFAILPKPQTTDKAKYLEWKNQTKAITLCLVRQGLEGVFNLHPEEEKLREASSLPPDLENWAKEMDTKVTQAMDLLIEHGIAPVDRDAHHAAHKTERRHSKRPSVSDHGKDK